MEPVLAMSLRCTTGEVKQLCSNTNGVVGNEAVKFSTRGKGVDAMAGELHVIVVTAESCTVVLWLQGHCVRAKARVHQRTMKALRILSDSLAVLFRHSACRTTSAHISEPIVESLDQQSSNLSDRQPAASDDETLTTTSTMFLQPDILEPTSYFQSLFNLTLVEYSKQTGIDLITHPFISSLDDICSVDKAITVLRERSQPLNNPRMGDNMVLLIGQIKSIFYIVSLLTPSEALCDNIDPVCQSDLDFNLHFTCTFSDVYYSNFHLQKLSMAASVFSLQCVAILITSVSI